MTTVYIDQNILEKAKQAGINISQFLETQLRLHLEKQQQNMAGPPGFEPGISGLEALNKPVDWDAFEKWLLQSHKPKTAAYLLNYAVRYRDLLFNRNFSPLLTMSDAKRRHILEALSNLSKFLGVYREFRGLVEAYGVKWSGKSYSELVIQRLTREKDA
ncbi:MAG: type II toxin-antitoxin system CcdA family antitoxin, partial [Nitrososphaerota archaeon]|nr:type II toxin-antitoxin system CcdA family antitoxin [Nitrososphaerota archaeon]